MTNPASGISNLVEPRGRVQYLTTDEAKRLLQECSYELRPIIVTALNTGIRKSEILNLRWDNIDLDKRLIRIDDTKNNEFRVVPINEILYNMLAPLERDEGYVFLSTYGKRYRPIDTGFRAALRRAGIEDFTFHDLRHTFASWLAMAGVDTLELKQLLGHKTLQMTTRYAHLSPSYLKETVEKLTQNSHKADIEETDEVVTA